MRIRALEGRGEKERKEGGREEGREERMSTYPKVGNPPAHPSKDLPLL